jgi:hypothetical protein
LALFLRSSASFSGNALVTTSAGTGHHLSLASSRMHLIRRSTKAQISPIALQKNTTNFAMFYLCHTQNQEPSTTQVKKKKEY